MSGELERIIRALGSERVQEAIAAELAAGHPSAESVMAIAERVCTERQLEVLRLRERGMSERAIADLLDISRGAVQERLRAGERRVVAEMERHP